MKDIDYIRRDAERARREFGYLRMWSIHPNQIVPIVEAMRPDFSEVEEATEILAAAQDVAWGPISTVAGCTTAPPTATTGSCCSARNRPAWRRLTRPRPLLRRLTNCHVAEPPASPHGIRRQTIVRSRHAAFQRANLAMFVGGFATFALLYGTQPMLPLFAASFGISPARASLRCPPAPRRSRWR